MIYAELSPCTKFYFGTREAYSYRGESSTSSLRWLKTMENGLAIYDECNLRQRFDEPRPDGTKYEQRSGYRLFPITSLCKYLNCGDKSYSRTATDNGFLSYFSQQELSYLKTQNVTMNVPSGYTKKYGKTYNYNCLVNLPFESQLNTYEREGSFGVDKSSIGWIIDADTLCKVYGYQHVNRVGGRYWQCISPVISIRDDAPVDRTENGDYIIRIPDPEFEGDLAQLLQWKEIA